ncbi:hypothetical protein QAD02_018418 [Eretmocerus hayati]|uniref:Uncharacterized protein n=1 Tax=Eretmocerus hayati TaxID=131215 RepID=A0ACC2PGQ7_9HYME|nr:hypothetical protein QAD02_018418 [Eretmocerus hayati]
MQEVVDETFQVHNFIIEVMETDNDAVMVAAVELVVNPNANRMVHVSCASHEGNLLLKSISPAAHLVILKVVLNFFKKSHHEQLLLQLGGTRIRDEEENDVPEHITDIIHDADSQDWLEQMLATLDPICISINMCQGLDRNVADAVDGWLSLQIPANPPGEFDDLLTNCIECAIKPAAFLAYVLHSMYQGSGLDDEQARIADNYIRVMFNADVVDEYKDCMRNMADFEDFGNRTNTYCILIGLLDSYWIPKLIGSS